MICFVTAFPAEAKPLIQHYDFKILETKPFPVYKSEIGFLIVSGMGKKSAEKAVSHLATLCPADSIWINVGIAGHQHKKVGEAFLAHKVVDAKTGKNWYPQILFTPKCKTATVLTVDQCENKYAEDAVYDMEAAGFYEEAVKFSIAELIHSFKVISDNAASPAANVSPKLGQALIEQNLECLIHLVGELAALKNTLPVKDLNLTKEFLSRWHFTVTESHQLRRLLSQLQTLCPNFLTSLRANEVSEAISKHGIASSALRPPRNDIKAKDILRFLKDQVESVPVSL